MLHRLRILFFISITAATLSGQSGANSPYSRFGIGDLTDNNFMASRQMGGLGSSFVDPYQVNIVNPASYSFLKATAFEVGLYGRRSNISEDQSSQTRWSGNLEYISLAFPLTNPINEVIEGKRRKFHIGMAFTLMPNSDVSYNVFSDETDENFGDFTLNYAGSGGSYKVLWGNAINYKDFALGFNVGYLFGDIRYERNTFFDDLPAAFVNNFVTDYRMRGFLYDIGLMYNTVLNRKELENNNGAGIKRLSAGIHFNSNTSFVTDADVSLISILSGASAVDSTNTLLGVEGSGTLPAEIGFGVTYQHNGKFGIGFDYSRTSWSQYTNDAESLSTSTPQALADTYSAAIGGYYRPSTKSYAKYLQRIFYRYGLFYNTDPRSDSGTAITDFGINLGLGLPVIYQRKISHLNLGIDLGRRGQGTAVEENYLQINFGFTFNDDEWFIKRKYN